MEISKDFLNAEILSLEQEIGKAQTFLTQAQAVLNAYRMLLARLDQSEPPPQEADNGGDLSSAP
jgi:hypothetical protein